MHIKYLVIIYFIFYLLKIGPILFNKDAGVLIETLDVGQGDAILITTANHKHILIDGGPDYGVDNYLFNRMPLGCHIEVIILTHPHKDHLAGLNRVLDRCTVDLIFYNKVEYPSKEFDLFTSKTKNFQSKSLFEGQKFTVDNISFYSLWPTASYLESKITNYNLISIVLLLDFGTKEALFMGDIENPILSNISSSSSLKHIDGRVELYKVSHHGSTTGLNTSFIRIINPIIASISVGEGNVYNHPHLEVIDFLDMQPTTILRTDLLGTIKINLNNLPK